MPYRTIVLAQGQTYHIFNRGVASLPIYLSSKDYSRFLEVLNYYRFASVSMSFSELMNLPKEERAKILDELQKRKNLQVEILTFCLMPNHFHLLLRQTTVKGISTFMKNLQNSYAKYFNIKNKRAGPLFQSMFKAVRIETDGQLLHVSRYIHLNPATGYLVYPKNLRQYPWSSFKSFLNEHAENSHFVNHDFILNFFKSRSYEQFVLDQADYQRELSKIKHLLLENP